MISVFRLALACLAALLVAGTVSAADNQPLLGKPGNLLFEDNFSRADMAPKWKVGKGNFAIKDGVVTAAENPADQHNAYAYVDPRFTYKDLVAEFSFKLDGAKACHFEMKDSNYKGSHAGHIVRATIQPGGVQLTDMKFGSMKNEIFDKMKDPATTADEKKQLQASIKDKQASFKVEFDLTKWHQARVEAAGDEMLLSIDGQPVGYLKSEGVNHPTKNMVGLAVGGQSAEFKDVKVWKAAISPGWASHRAEVVGALSKAP